MARESIAPATKIPRKIALEQNAPKWGYREPEFVLARGRVRLVFIDHPLISRIVAAWGLTHGYPYSDFDEPAPY